MTSPISDMLITIKNAQAVGKEQVSVPFSTIKYKIAMVLKDAGFVSDVERKKKKNIKGTEHEFIDIVLKYADKFPGISGVQIVSKPSRHMYIKAEEIKPVRSGYGIAVISTSKGIMSSKEAKKNNLGGEIMFEIW